MITLDTFLQAILGAGDAPATAAAVAVADPDDDGDIMGDFGGITAPPVALTGFARHLLERAYATPGEILATASTVTTQNDDPGVRSLPKNLYYWRPDPEAGRIHHTLLAEMDAKTDGGAEKLSKASRMALTSAVEAIALAASRVLQIDEGELSGWWTPLLGGQTDAAQLYLYDLLPGGAGYARAVGDAIDDVLDAAEVMLAGCNCVTSCYRCIRHYGNHWIHASLDRYLALALIQHIRTGRVPSLDEAARSSALKGLCEILRLRKHDCVVDADIGGVHVPLLLKRRTGDRWFDVHHPLIDPHATPSPVALAARGLGIEFGSVDAFDLLHDLPVAVERVLTRGSGQ